MTIDEEHPTEWRVQFDAEVTFRNGGGLSAREFRLDAPGPDLADGVVGELFVRHLALLMVETVTIRDKTFLREAHKGSRGVATEPAAASRPVRRLGGGTLLLAPGLDAAEAQAGLLGLEAVVLRTSGSTERTVDRAALLATEAAGRAVLVDARSAEGVLLTEDAAEYLLGEGATLVGLESQADQDADPGVAALVAAGVPVVTGLSGLDGLPPQGFRLHLVPQAAAASDAGVAVHVYVDER